MFLITSLLIVVVLLLVVAILLFVSILKKGENQMPLNFNAFNAALSDVETLAMPGESAADQAVIDQAASRLRDVASRFGSAPVTVTPAPATPDEPADVANPPSDNA